LSANFNTTNAQHQNFHENPFSGQRVATCEQTDEWKDRHDDANEYS